MAKFNNVVQTTKTVNKAGGQAYTLSNTVKLMTEVLTTFFNERKYYGDNSNDIVADIRNMLNVNPKFVANLCVYTRNVMHLRSISHVMAGELANHPNGKQFARLAISKIVERPDDMVEILAYYIKTFGKPIPNSLKKGIADAFVRFDEYSLAKYNNMSKAIKLKDVLFMCHPTPKNQEQYDLWGKLIEDRLEVPITWETELSAKGNTKSVWEKLIEENKVGYMAMLRNLRNIINSGASNLNKALDYLQNPDAIRKSKQLPFRFFSAYKEVEKLSGVSKTLGVIENALATSIENLPKFTGTTMLISDNSGSMDSQLSRNGDVTYKDVGSLMMAMANKFCEDSITSVFGDRFSVVNVSPNGGIINNMNKFKSTNVGYSTNLYTAFEWLLQTKTKVDRIMVFSDMQCYGESGYYGSSRTVQGLLDRYKKEVNPNVWMHSIDLAGYGTAQFSANSKLNLLGGWSDKVIEFMYLVENGIDTLINSIEGYYFK